MEEKLGPNKVPKHWSFNQFMRGTSTNRKDPDEFLHKMTAHQSLHF